MEFEVIGHIKTCYGEKFGTPRQPGLVDEAWGELIFESGYRDTDAVRGLGEFSHVWLVFAFHQARRDGWSPTVRPPRLGGNQKVGVFASRSPFRPNPIGLSCVRLQRIDLEHKNAPILHLRGVDLVDGTPILDIKPYIPYADALPDATGGFAPSPPTFLEVGWQDGIGDSLDQETKNLIEHTLAIDPRPAYQHGEVGREYGCLISGWNVKWKVCDAFVLISACHTA